MSNSNQSIVVAVMAHRLPRHEPAPALAPVGMALLVLAVLGAIVLLVGRVAHHPAARGCRRAEVAGGEPRQQPADPKSLAPVHGSASSLASL
jgi:hypothetical protein